MCLGNSYLVFTRGHFFLEKFFYLTLETLFLFHLTPKLEILLIHHSFYFSFSI